MNHRVSASGRGRAFTLMEVMVSASLLVLIIAVVLTLALFCTRSVKKQTLAFDATDAVHRLVGRLNSDCSGVGVVQLFKVPAGAVPPFAAGSWDGTALDGNFMILAYPRNILNQNSPMVRLCAYYIDPRDNSLMRIEADYSGMKDSEKNDTGGITITGDLMTALNQALTKTAGTATTERLCYAYPWAMQTAAPSSRNSWSVDTVTGSRVVRIPVSSDASNMKPRSLFYAYGGGILAITGAIAVLSGDEAAKSSINYTLNVRN